MIISTVLALGLMGGHLASPSSPESNPTAQGAVVATSSASTPADPNIQYDLYQFEEVPGSAPISLVWGGKARDAWGSSYAYSNEVLQFFYTGRAKAAGNVYQNLRIVQVCIWYSRGSVAVSSTVCSFASSDTGTWLPGPEVSVSATDSLDSYAPHTIFNIQTGRINPAII
jgi:hypothetical protein